VKAKSEIRISKSETNPKSKEENSPTVGLGFSGFGFFSDFDIRISDLFPYSSANPAFPVFSSASLQPEKSSCSVAE